MASLGYMKVYLKKREGLWGGRKREGDVPLNVEGNWNPVALKSCVITRAGTEIHYIGSQQGE